jgi:hypothetical protein
MANLDQPRGFEVFGSLMRASVYESGSACYPGDMVALASDGQVDPAGATGSLLGLCLSYASASGAQILVADHPDQLFSAQCDETEGDVQSDIGNTAGIVATAGNSTYKTSRQEIDSSDIAQGSSQALMVLGLDRTVNNAFGAQSKLIIRINEHQLKEASVGV